MTFVQNEEGKQIKRSNMGRFCAADCNGTLVAL